MKTYRNICPQTQGLILCPRTQGFRVLVYEDTGILNPRVRGQRDLCLCLCPLYHGHKIPVSEDTRICVLTLVLVKGINPF